MVPPPVCPANGGTQEAFDSVRLRQWRSRGQVGGWWIATAAYAALLFVVSVIPVEPKAGVPYLDKVAHLGEYLLFAWLLAQAVRAARRRDRVVSLWAWIVATSYGGLLEGVQAMLPWRSAELADAVANAVGAALGVWLAR